MATNLSAAEVRQRCRRGELTGPTAGLARGHTQANLVVLPRASAYDFLLFCQRNPKPCPVLEVTDAGDPDPRELAPGADLRTDLPRYRVFRRGEPVAEPTSVEDYWRDDLVSFLLGCSFTFEAALEAAGLGVRHPEEGVNVPMYRTRLPCRPAGPFAGPLVVSMQPYTPAQAIAAVEVLPESGSQSVRSGSPRGASAPESKRIGAPRAGQISTPSGRRLGPLRGQQKVSLDAAGAVPLPPRPRQSGAFGWNLADPGSHPAISLKGPQRARSIWNFR